MKWLDLNIDRRIIYLLVAVALSAPLVLKYTVKPARMVDAEKFFEIVEQVKVAPEEFAFVALDFGPNSQAENYSQAFVVVEHLMRKRLPILLFSEYYLAEPYLKSLPEDVAKKLEAETPGKSWQYGKDWINLGFRPGAGLLLQAIPKSDDLAGLFKKDVLGNTITEMPIFGKLKRINQIKILAEFSSLLGALDSYLQYFKKKDYVPLFGHGCTSITIPEAFTYLDSGQINGLLGGVAGAAWYSHLLTQAYPERSVDPSLLINTGLGVAQLIIILLIVLGNVTSLLQGRRK